jgi:hypothetical protein
MPFFVFFVVRQCRVRAAPILYVAPYSRVRFSRVMLTEIVSLFLCSCRGNRELEALVAILPWVERVFSPRLLVVKSEVCVVFSSRLLTA